MSIIGVDPGIASCGVAILDDDCQLLDCGVFVSKKSKERGDHQRRIVLLIEWLSQRIVRPHEFHTCVVEWPGGQFGKGASNVRSLSLLYSGAACAVTFLRLKCPEAQHLTPHPVTWRKAMSGTSKEESLHRQLELTYSVVRQVGKQRAPHAYDAVGLALYGLQVRARLLEEPASRSK